jgi:hypothetical protein
VHFLLSGKSMSASDRESSSLLEKNDGGGDLQGAAGVIGFQLCCVVKAFARTIVDLI